jgi:hypothetical protein
MKQEIYIIDFLKTGKFGTVAIGDAMETVIKKLGKPDWEHNYEVTKPRRGICYSYYEFMFLDDKLECIQNDHFNPDNPELMEFENDTFKLNTAFLKADRVKKFPEIEAELKQRNIPFTIIKYWERKAIKTIGNVILDFSDEKWSDEKEDFVKITNPDDYEFLRIAKHDGELYESEYLGV